MKKTILFLLAFVANISFFISSLHGKTVPPDTVKVGIYVTSVHNIDFRQKEFSMNLWLWLKYKRLDFDFQKNLEVPNAKTFEKSYTTVDTLVDGTIYMLMKLQCVMKGDWRINHFPFDHQKLRFSIENSMYDASELIFAIDTFGKHYGKYFLTEWEKDSFIIKSELKDYETAFGDPALDKPHSAYSAFKVIIAVHRDSWELFFKLFLGMYISFLIASICFYIPTSKLDSRLALCVGALFAVIGNKYIIDSALPESNTFTLVDSLHGYTLFYIFMVIATSVMTTKLIKENKIEQAGNYNKLIGRTLFILYICVNAWYIYRAIYSVALR